MIKINVERCTACGTCVDTCAQGAISLRGQVATIDYSRCDECASCLSACPQGAIYGVRETLPQRVPVDVAPASPAPTPVASTVSSVAKRVVTGLAPVALNVGLALVDRWLARRSGVPGLASSLETRVFDEPGLADRPRPSGIGGLGMGMGRRLRRRGRFGR